MALRRLGVKPSCALISETAARSSPSGYNIALYVAVVGTPGI